MPGVAATANATELPVGFRGPEPREATLLELVSAICAVTSDDEEVIATVRNMLRSGRVRLCGNFHGMESELL
jgi:hypothetical protein